MTASTPKAVDVPLRRIVQAWWPLALSALLMGIERPAIIAVIARLSDSEVNIAAFGSVVAPLLDAINAPIIMLLAASTALSKDIESYRKVFRFMNFAALALTAVHALIAFTPLYYVVVGRLIDAPKEVIEPSRVGLMITLPWTWVIAYRRINQGVLIRFGHSRAVGLGTIVRLLSGWAVLGAGYAIGGVPGAALGAAANLVGCAGEAGFIALQARPVLRDEVRRAPAVDRPITLRWFIRFYAPLSLTTVVVQTMPAITSAALSRMANPLETLAVWPVVSSLSYLLRSAGLAYNEVVVAMLDVRNALASVRRFAGVLAVALTAVILGMVATPIAGVWFGRVSGLSAQLSALARGALWIILPTGALAAFQTFFQGALVHSRRTRAVIEAVGIVTGVSLVIVIAGLLWGRVSGVYVAAVAYTVSALAQTAWLWYRSRPALEAVRVRDQLPRAPGAETVPAP